jgi:C1A family cysteine protease
MNYSPSKNSIFFNIKNLLYVMVFLIILSIVFRKKITLEDIKTRIFSIKEILLNEKRERKLMYEYVPDPEEKIPKDYVTDKRFLSPVLDQQNCGSCTAFTLTALITTNYLRNKHKEKYPTKKMKLSPQILLSCRKEPFCRGWWVYSWIYSLLMNEYKEFSFITRWKDLPYNFCNNCTKEQESKIRSSCTVPENKLLKKEHDQFRLSSFKVISNDGDSTQLFIDNVKRAIYKYGAVSGSFRVYKTIYNDLSKSPYEHNAIPEMNTHNTFEGGHAILIVGWKDGFWRIQNSWGTGHADGGFFWLKWGSLKASILCVDVFVKKYKPPTKQ